MIHNLYISGASEFQDAFLFPAFLEELTESIQEAALAEYARRDGDVPEKDEVRDFITRIAGEKNLLFPQAPDIYRIITMDWTVTLDLDRPIVVAACSVEGIIHRDSVISTHIDFAGAYGSVWDRCIDAWRDAFINEAKAQKAEAFKAKQEADREALTKFENIVDTTTATATALAPALHTDHIQTLLRRAAKDKEIHIMNWLFQQLPKGHPYSGVRSDGSLIGPYNEQKAL